MKLVILATAVLLTNTLIAQTKTAQVLKGINTIEEAETFTNEHENSELLYISSMNENTPIKKKLLSASKGEILTSGDFIYKVIDKTIQTNYRVTYIYLDGSKLNLKEVDSIRNLIISMYKSGTPFPRLAEEFNMDGNPNGDTGFFNEGMMVKEFEDAIKLRKTGEVFKVDIPSNNWYYVVKKTYPEKTSTKVTVLKVRDDN